MALRFTNVNYALSNEFNFVVILNFINIITHVIYKQLRVVSLFCDLINNVLYYYFEEFNDVHG